MSGNPWGDTGRDPFAEGGLSDGLAVDPGMVRKRWWQQRSGILATAAVLVSVASLIASLAGAAGYGAVGAAAVGYLLAVLADVSARRSRYEVGDYRRPKLPAMPALRVVAFGLATWAAWLAASSLAGST